MRFLKRIRQYHKSGIKSADTTPAGPTSNTFTPTNILAHEGMLSGIQFLEQWLRDSEIVAFSETCQKARGMSSDLRKKLSVKTLLAAVVKGKKALAEKIINSRPELLLEKSATVTDLSGKVIKGLTPLQAAICAGDEDMSKMLIEVFYQKILKRVPLSKEPELVIRNQFEEIYHKGSIGLTATLQKKKAQYFKDSTLQNLFNTINAATPAQVKYELDNPGRKLNKPDEELNEVLHKFRKYVDDKSKAEQIFNPYDLLAAFELYNEQFNGFNGNPGSEEKWNRRKLFWRQVIGYIQRHLPACYWQRFAQGNIKNNEKLMRNFEFKCDKGFYMRAVNGDLNNLGYKYAADGAYPLRNVDGGRVWVAEIIDCFPKLIENKNIKFGDLMHLYTRRAADNNSMITHRAQLVCNRVRYSRCNIC